MKLKLLPLIFLTIPLMAQKSNSRLEYNIETFANFSSGEYAPFWFTANRYGLGSVEPNSFYLKAGVDWKRNFNHGWKVGAGLDLAAGANISTNFSIHQAYVDVAWRALNLSIGSKERINSPLDKNPLLTSGWMTEGINTIPVPQVRVEIKDFLDIPFLNDWLALKGHLAYGAFSDNTWQKDFAKPGNLYGKDIKYHSKALMFRLGKKEKFPLEFEFGLHMATQFCGDQMRKLEDGSSELVLDMPDGFKNYINALFPAAGGDGTTWGEQVNVEGNMLGSWNFALNYYYGDWKFRAYLDHFFEDHSQMFWEYGRWKDGQIGIEVTLPQNRWLSSVVWEGISTYDQTGPVLYDGFAGSFSDLQMSGCDLYFNHYIYQSWQYFGMGMGAPLLPGPAYNRDGSISFRSNRMKGIHFGFMGNPSDEWSWRMLLSHTRHWGTYASPLDKVRKQFSSMAEVAYSPQRFKVWTFKAARGVDGGNYLGKSMGGMLGIQMKLNNR